MHMQIIDNPFDSVDFFLGQGVDSLKERALQIQGATFFRPTTTKESIPGFERIR